MSKWSRPERLERICADLRELHLGYEDWLQVLPEPQTDGVLAEKLETTIEVLEEVLDQLDSLDLPRGFGRD